MLGALLPQLVSAAPEKASGRYLVRARSSADYAGLRAKAVKDGARVLRDLKQVNTMVVSAPASARGQPGRRPADPRGRSQPGAQDHR